MPPCVRNWRPPQQEMLHYKGVDQFSTKGGKMSQKDPPVPDIEKHPCENRHKLKHGGLLWVLKGGPSKKPPKPNLEPSNPISDVTHVVSFLSEFQCFFPLPNWPSTIIGQSKTSSWDMSPLNSQKLKKMSTISHPTANRSQAELGFGSFFSAFLTRFRERPPAAQNQLSKEFGLRLLDAIQGTSLLSTTRLQALDGLFCPPVVSTNPWVKV